MSQRDYNHVYSWGRFILQIMQKGQHDGIVIHFLPQITLAVNNSHCSVAVGLEWITGTLNFGIMTKQYAKVERERTERVREVATKAGLTERQQELRWGW